MKKYLKIHTLAASVAIVLSGCGGDNDNNNNEPTVPSSNPTITVTEGHSDQVLPVKPEDEVKIATYAMTHDISYADKPVMDFMEEGSNIINLPNTNYEVGDTIEFKDTIIKIDSKIDNGEYAVVPAGIFDVFSELEIDTSLVMGKEESTQLGVVGTPDLLNAAEKIEDIYKDLEEKNCLPSTRKDITVNGIPSNHRLSYTNGSYNGVQIALKDCKLLETENSLIKTDQSLNVGMTSRINISSKNKVALFQIDGAALLNGKLDVNFNDTENINIRLATYKPAILRGLEASEVESLEKLLRAQIYLNLKTLIKGSLKGTTGIQVPADFAMGVSAKYDEQAKKWSFKEYDLTNNKNVALDEDILGVSYDVEVMDMKLGSALEAGYAFNLEAESPWFKEEANKERSWFKETINRIKNYNEPLLTGDIAVRSFGSVSAGLLLDTHVGSKVKVEDCRVDYSAVMGAFNYNSLFARAGAKLIQYPEPPNSPLMISRHVFNNPITFFKLSMFDVDKKDKKDWCGPTSKLKGLVGTKYRKILVSDLEGNSIISSEYIIDWNESLNQAGLFQVGATISDTDKLWLELQNFVSPSKVVQEFTLPTEVPEGLLSLEYYDNTTKYSMDDEGWEFAWKTFNPGITIKNDRSRTPSFAIDCKDKCSDDPILLAVRSPDGKNAFLQFQPKFADELTVEASAIISPEEMTLRAESNYGGAKYTWKNSEGQVLVSQKPELVIPSNSDFAVQASIDGALTLTTEALGQTSEIKVNIEQDVLNPVEQTVNKMVGYWKSECIKESDNSDSKIYFVNFEKVSKQALKIVHSIKYNFADDSCKGKPYVIVKTDSEGEIFTIDDSKMPVLFINDNRFIVGDDFKEIYNRISVSEFPESPADNNTVPEIQNIVFSPATTKAPAYITVSFNTEMSKSYYTTGAYNPIQSYWKNSRTFIVEFQSYTPGGTISFKALNGQGEKGFMNSSGILLKQDRTFTFP